MPIAPPRPPSKREVGKVIVGQQEVVRACWSAILAGGHALLEGVPGLGKTMLVRTLAEALRAGVQPHPVHARPDARRHHRHRHPGGERRRAAQLPLPARARLRQPRAGRRDQPRHAQDAVGAARGDAGAHGHGGQRAPTALPEPFFVLATQNPIEDGGHLPAARGAARPLPVQGQRPLPLGRRPDGDPEPHHRAGQPARPSPPPTARGSSPCRQLARQVPIPTHVSDYISRLVVATHPGRPARRRVVSQYVRYGASPRGAQALVLGAKVTALLDGRYNVSFDDVPPWPRRRCATACCSTLKARRTRYDRLTLLPTCCSPYRATTASHEHPL